MLAKMSKIMTYLRRRSLHLCIAVQVEEEAEAGVGDVRMIEYFD